MNLDYNELFLDYLNLLKDEIVKRMKRKLIKNYKFKKEDVLKVYQAYDLIRSIKEEI